MRLIGIKLERCKEKYLKKNLIEGCWYPFGEFNVKEEPTQSNISQYKTNLKERKSNGLYFIQGKNNKQIEVNVSCMVGKNGSGKSTIIDIMIAIINNFAATEMGDRYLKLYGKELVKVKGLWASLFYEEKTDSKEKEVYEIRSAGEETHLYMVADGTAVDVKNGKSKLMEFFYTVVVSYSMYSFNTLDYRNARNSLKYDYDISDVKNSWLAQLFHKNDGYTTPIVLTPFRLTGNIDINRENYLARQRLSALVLQFASMNEDLLPKYSGTHILYTHINKYRKPPFKISEWDYKKKNNPHFVLHTKIKELLKIRYPDAVPLKDEILNYMAYKVIKICKTYSDFKNVFNVTNCTKAIEKFNVNASLLELCVRQYKASIENVIDKIEHDHSHISVKYHQAQSWLTKTNKYLTTKDEYDIQKRISFKDILGDEKNITYEKALELLPPPIFDVDVKFKKPDNSTVTFSSMSSGERQILFSLSNVLYHIKNIESIHRDYYRIPYRNINIILDEVELYSHPEYQRNYIKGALDCLSWIKIDPDKIKSINILVVTHSPFILSDIPQSNILYLENGTVVNNKITVNPFAANVNDVLSQSFFLQNGFIGEYAKQRLNNLIDALSKSEGKEGNVTEQDEVIQNATNLIDNVGDVVLRNLLNDILEEYKARQKD